MLYIYCMYILYIYKLYIDVYHLISLKNTTPFHVVFQRNASSNAATTESRSNHQRCSVKKVNLKISTKFTGKHLCWNLFLLKSDSNIDIFLRNL